MTTTQEISNANMNLGSKSIDINDELGQNMQQLSLSSSASASEFVQIPECPSTDSITTTASNNMTTTIAGRHGHLISKNIAEVEREIFVGDLSFFCKEYDLHTLFSQYGKVVGTRIRRSESTNQSLMYGFVKMDTAEQAKVAVQNLENKMFMGRILR